MLSNGLRIGRGVKKADPKRILFGSKADPKKYQSVSRLEPFWIPNGSFASSLSRNHLVFNDFVAEMVSGCRAYGNEKCLGFVRELCVVRCCVDLGRETGEAASGGAGTAEWRKL